ncbi:MAG: PIN domain-containing protein [Leptolyngbyaceae cyanobacterium bins.302]|nr:PIN domain-containing protein [Leptolyngbyaceae cyanobacterium bins.302]
MRNLFVDTFYWTALINSKDDWHQRVLELTTNLRSPRFITTEEVLLEVLNFFCNQGVRSRQHAIDLINDVLNNPEVEVIEQTHQSFMAGFGLYQSRLDKGYSLTDCISMQTMRQLGITEILTHDKHFAQEGFVILLID